MRGRTNSIASRFEPRRLTGLLLLGFGLAEPDLFGDYSTKMNRALVDQ
jgi:hypothetical protein